MVKHPLIVTVYPLYQEKKEAGLAFKELKILCLRQITVRKISYCLYIKGHRGSSWNICQVESFLSYDLNVLALYFRFCIKEIHMHITILI